jgi:hypothetical protein
MHGKAAEILDKHGKGEEKRRKKALNSNRAN